jgi:hypothetical protein
MMTIQIDDAGSGDLLFGTVIGAYHREKDFFIYDVIDVKYWQNPLYITEGYKIEAQRIALKLLARLAPEEDERIEICRGNILDEAVKAITEKYGEEMIHRCRITDKAQYLVELAYINELRNLGYEPINNRVNNWRKNFWHMFHWVEKKPNIRLKWCKTGLPNLKRFRLFR